MGEHRFSEAIVGDRVECFVNGKGEISRVDITDAYPIKVLFDNTLQESYTYEGKTFNCSRRRPTLFYQDVRFDTTGGEAPPSRTKTVKGKEVPALSFNPSKGDTFFYPVEGDKIVKWAVFVESPFHSALAKEGKCYPATLEGMVAAGQHSEALRGYKEQDNDRDT